MRRFLPYIAALALYAVTPLSAEVTENLVHLAMDGHLAHSDAGHEGEDEHGCSATFHLCPCHQAVSLASDREVCRVPQATQASAMRTPCTEEAVTRVTEVFRPPIA